MDVTIVNRNNKMVRKAGSRDRICYCLAIIEVRVHKCVIPVIISINYYVTFDPNFYIHTCVMCIVSLCV